MNISKYFQHRFTLSGRRGKDLYKRGYSFSFSQPGTDAAGNLHLSVHHRLPAPCYPSREQHDARALVLRADGSLFYDVLFVIAMIQYKSTYTKIYTESANRRIGDCREAA